MLESWLLLFCLPLLLCETISKRPNVLLFIIDDLRPALGCYGDRQAITKNIDRLAEGSILFKHTYAQQALCAPSRNSFLTSRRPDTLHLYDFYNYWRSFAGNFTTLPQYFKENGYETMSIGKVFHPGVSSNYSDDQPYSWSSTPFHPKTEVYENAKVCFSKGNPFPQQNLVCPVNTTLQPLKTLPDIESREKAIKYLLERNNSEKPFFLAVGFHKPHIPFRYPEKYKKWHPLKKIKLPFIRRKPLGLPNVAWNPWTDLRSRDDIKELNISFPFGVIEDDQAKLIKQSYYAAVSYVDVQIGLILTMLKYLKMEKQTIIALIGDHGWSLGEHGEWAKYSNFEVASRVPFILKYPGLIHSSKVSKPTVISEPVELIDLFPTLVDMTGLKPLKTCSHQDKSDLCTEGKSLFPLIKDVLNYANINKNLKERRLWKIHAFNQYPRPGEFPTAFPNSDKPMLNQIKIMGCSIRTIRYRYTEWLGFKNLKIVWNDIRAVELYDHRFDPYESVNLSKNESYFKIKKRLRKLLKNNWINNTN